MEKIKEFKVHIHVQEKQSFCIAHLMQYSRADAMKKAAITYVFTIALAGVTVFIPIVHFISVPGLLLMGPFISFLIYNTFSKQQVLQFQETCCPACHAPLNLSSDFGKWPLRDRCESCGDYFLAELSEEG